MAPGKIFAQLKTILASLWLVSLAKTGLSCENLRPAARGGLAEKNER
jgi:hypothetical protein